MIKIDSEIPPHLLFMKHVLLHLVSASVLKQILKETTVLIKYFRLKFAIISFSILAFGTVWTYFFSTSSLDLQDHTHLWGGGNNCSQKCGLNSITRYIRNNNTVSFWVKSNLVKLEASYTAILPYCACSLDQLMNTNIMNTNTMN